ncbi:hypothetical protein H6F42_08270 [Pseudanabaena sp. FACHB-1998]|uniref:DUF4114 domain-containing protein n=1 Tax=Pseudanabaena sp. FACHB-1998 TaxID=2692858 RepID=UPI001680F994|nr:DUF4114 domain-containing protein [Pseudanabaena sp. FACHB-1998]MBD2176905.1 hypothetical protein [Pseudanabaena sp. FACHB-1998]
MKSSALTLGLGILAVTGSMMVAASSEAATLVFADGPSLSGTEFEFEFLPPTVGSYVSELFVTDVAKSGVVQTLFTEVPSNNGSVTPNSVVLSGSWAATNGSYLLGWGNAGDPVLSATVYSNDTTPFQFRLDSSVGGWYTYAIEDIKGGGDLDFNDGRFRVRAVPVPAIVPGIALAAAFLGSKALKRKKQDASESVG